MINFPTLQGLTIPEGVVTQITDASGMVLWSLQNDKPIILEVAKIKGQTYAGETQYADEEFILLDVYPKSAESTVNVTYGGLTKTLTFSGTNAQQVFFGTLYGESDGVATPASGTLTIDGDYSGAGIGSYVNDNKDGTAYCGCVTAIIDLGSSKEIPGGAFYLCTNLTGNIVIPDSVSSIGMNAFQSTKITSMTVLSTTPPTVLSGTMGTISTLVSINVPAGCGEAYKAASGWSKYADKIVEAS